MLALVNNNVPPPTLMMLPGSGNTPEKVVLELSLPSVSALPPNCTCAPVGLPAASESEPIVAAIAPLKSNVVLLDMTTAVPSGSTGAGMAASSKLPSPGSVMA